MRPGDPGTGMRVEQIASCSSVVCVPSVEATGGWPTFHHDGLSQDRDMQSANDQLEQSWVEMR